MPLNAPEYFNHPFLKQNKILYRHYQENIAHRCKSKNSLVVLPTGLGKTIIGIILMAYRLLEYSGAKIIILAPTRPLVSQHKAACEKYLNIPLEHICLLNGKLPPEKRYQLFIKSKIIIATPQVIKNDVKRGRYELNQVSLIIFDEAHHTKGNYAYNFISKEYMNSCTDPLILGLTASPGKDYEYIQQLCNNLFIENIAFRTYDDEDVVDYIHDVDTFIERIDLPIKIIEISQVWNDLFNKFLRFFIDRKLINPHKRYYSKLDFLRISHDLTLSLQYEQYYNSELQGEEYIEELYYQEPRIIDIVRGKKLNIQSIFSYCSSCISILHAKDLLETQNISLFVSFLNRLKFRAEQDLLSAKRIINSKHYLFVKSEIENEGQSKLAHPKINKVKSLIKEEIKEFQNSKIIIFTQYREMAEFLKSSLRDEFSHYLKVEKFIGQSSKIDDTGFSQTKQIDILKEFRENNINILIATSVAEEGLDIPNVDAIICYEPVPSEIRLIQRRGRTGRFASGRCYILMTEDTVDVPFNRVAKRKESTMNSILLEPEQLELQTEISRKKINITDDNSKRSEFDLIKDFRERRDQEKELLADRSVDDIIMELDNFSKSEEYKKLKRHNVTFVSDILPLDELKLKKSVEKMKGKRTQKSNNPKQYLNNNVKTLIKIAKTYCEDGRLSLLEFKEFASQEDIVEKKFYVHFNHACNLGYLKKHAEYVLFVKDYT
jgi:Fanconi anemia group M protein